MRNAVLAYIIVVAAATARAQYSGPFNVKDFGAVGNGSSDDTPAITAALGAASTNGGGVVYFPPGTYQVRPAVSNSYDFEGKWAAFWVNIDNLTLRGEGPNQSRIVLTNDRPGSILGSALFWFGSQQGPDPIHHANNLVVEGLTLDGGCQNTTSANNTAGYTLVDLATCTNAVVRNCALINSQEHAIDCECFATTRVLVEYCTVSNHASAGIHGDGAGQLLRIHNCEIYRCGMTVYPQNATMYFMNPANAAGFAAGVDNQCGAQLDIRNCVFGWSPVNLCIMTHGTVQDCTFYNDAHGTNVIFCGGGGGELGLFSGNKIYQFDISSYRPDVLFLTNTYPARGFVIEGNHFYFSELSFGCSALPDIAATEGLITGNRFLGFGIYFWGARGVNVIGNTFFPMNSYNIVFLHNNAENNHIIGNVFEPMYPGQTLVSVQAPNCHGNVLKDNIFAGGGLYLGSWNWFVSGNRIDGTFHIDDVGHLRVENNYIKNLKVTGPDSGIDNIFRRNVIDAIDSGTTTPLSRLILDGNSGVLAMTLGPTNAISTWPVASATPGGYAIVNSNATVYLLTSTPDSTIWAATNKLGGP